MTTMPAIQRVIARHDATPHVHFRENGWGLAGHQHIVVSEIHEHDGLRSVQLGWAVYRWHYVRARGVDFGAAAVAVAVSLAFLTLGFSALVSR